MIFDQFVYDLQAAVSSLGAFICFWGFVQFAPCLWRVLRNTHLHPAHSQCPFHATVAVVCLTGVTFAFARMNTIGFFVFGSSAAGLAYSGGMIALVIAVALAVWAQGRAHQEAALSQWKTPIKGSVTLSRVLTAMLIIILAFVAVGLIRAGMYS